MSRADDEARDGPERTRRVRSPSSKGTAPLSFRPLLRRRRAVLLAYGLLALTLAPGLARLEVDNSPELLFPHDAAAITEYRSLERDFGPDRGVRVVLRGPGLWTGSGLTWARQVEEAAAELPGVAGAAGSVLLHRWHEPVWPPAQPDSFRSHLLRSALDRQAGWVSADGTTLTVLVGMHRQGPQARRQVLADLQRLVAGAPPDVETAIVGLPVIERTVDEAVERLLAVILPLVAVLMVGILALAFGVRPDTAAPLLLVALTELVVFGGIGYSGGRVDIVLSALPAILLVVGLATGVHVLHTVRDRLSAGLDAEDAVEATYRVKAWPVLWTGLTTGVGFGSFAASPSLPVQRLGMWLAFGITFFTIAALTFYPALLASLASRRPSSAHRPSTAAAAIRTGATTLLRSALEHRRTCHALFALVAAAALLFWPRLEIDTDLLNYLEPTSAPRADLERLESQGVGVLAGDLVITTTSDRTASGPLGDLEHLSQLGSLGEELRRLPGILSVVSAADLVDGLASSCPLPAAAGSDPRLDDPRVASLATIHSVPELDRMFRLLVTPSGRRARLSMLVRAGGMEELAPTFAAAAEHARCRFPTARVVVTGQYPLILTAQGSILRSMALALLLTVTTIVLLFRLAVGSWSAAWRALLPNFWAVVLVLGLMGWRRVPLDSMSVMIASAVLGLVVDDTLHYLGFLRRSLPATPTIDTDALRLASTAALREAAPGHVLTSLILAVGFAAIGLSSLVPLASFGLYLSFGIVSALVADLLWVPTLMASLSTKALGRLLQREPTNDRDTGPAG